MSKSIKATQIDINRQDNNMIKNAFAGRFWDNKK